MRLAMGGTPAPMVTTHPLVVTSFPVSHVSCCQPKGAVGCLSLCCGSGCLTIVYAYPTGVLLFYGDCAHAICVAMLPGLSCA